MMDIERSWNVWLRRACRRSAVGTVDSTGSQTIDNLPSTEVDATKVDGPDQRKADNTCIQETASSRRIASRQDREDSPINSQSKRPRARSRSRECGPTGFLMDNSQRSESLWNCKCMPPTQPNTSGFTPRIHQQQTLSQPHASKSASFLAHPGNLVRQPETRPISHEQLIEEVKGIYSGLVMAESRCVEIDPSSLVDKEEFNKKDSCKLSPEQWQALVALSHTLDELHDFFLASRHPSASPAMRRLAKKRGILAPIWRHSFDSLLELLWHRLPASREHMLTIIYHAYSMIADQITQDSEDTWIKCLGDLGRWRMAIEDDDIRDRDLWRAAFGQWYDIAKKYMPTTGRLYFHLDGLRRGVDVERSYRYIKRLSTTNYRTHALRSDPVLCELTIACCMRSLITVGPRWKEQHEPTNVIPATRAVDETMGDLRPPYPLTQHEFISSQRSIGPNRTLLRVLTLRLGRFLKAMTRTLSRCPRTYQLRMLACVFWDRAAAMPVSLGTNGSEPSINVTVQEILDIAVPGVVFAICAVFLFILKSRASFGLAMLAINLLLLNAAFGNIAPPSVRWILYLFASYTTFRFAQMDLQELDQNEDYALVVVLTGIGINILVGLAALGAVGGGTGSFFLLTVPSLAAGSWICGRLHRRWYSVVRS